MINSVLIISGYFGYFSNAIFFTFSPWSYKFSAFAEWEFLGKVFYIIYLGKFANAFPSPVDNCCFQIFHLQSVLNWSELYLDIYSEAGGMLNMV